MLVAYLYNGRHPWKLRMKSMYVSNWIWPEGHFIWEKGRLQLHIFSPKLQERLQQLDLTERSGSTLQSRQGDQVGLPNRSQTIHVGFVQLPGVLGTHSLEMGSDISLRVCFLWSTKT